LVILHWAPTITAPVRSVTLPEIRAFSVCAHAAAADRRRVKTSTGDFIEHSPNATPCARHAHNQFFLGKLARELWASERLGLRAPSSMRLLGKFLTEGILSKAVCVVIFAPRGGRSTQSFQQHQKVSPHIVLDFTKTTRPDIG
jgi:hypothetical protein